MSVKFYGEGLKALADMSAKGRTQNKSSSLNGRAIKRGGGGKGQGH